MWPAALVAADTQKSSVVAIWACGPKCAGSLTTFSHGAGHSSWCSSLSVFNEVLRRRPDLAQVCAAPLSIAPHRRETERRSAPRPQMSVPRGAASIVQPPDQMPAQRWGAIGLGYPLPSFDASGSKRRCYGRTVARTCRSSSSRSTSTGRARSLPVSSPRTPCGSSHGRCDHDLTQTLTHTGTPALLLP